jgi:hypothetical protein
MPDDKRALGDRLVELEPVTPALKQRYEQEIKAMFERPLKPVERLAWIAASVFSFGTAVAFVAIAALAPPQFPLSGRLCFVIGALFGVAFGVVAWRIVRRGAMRLNAEGAAWAGLAWALPVALVTLFLVFAPQDLIGLRMIVSGVVFLIGGAVFLLGHIIQQAALNTREKLLEIELALAELRESTKPRQ